MYSVMQISPISCAAALCFLHEPIELGALMSVIYPAEPRIV